MYSGATQEVGLERIEPVVFSSRQLFSTSVLFVFSLLYWVEQGSLLCGTGIFGHLCGWDSFFFVKTKQRARVATFPVQKDTGKCGMQKGAKCSY